MAQSKSAKNFLMQSYQYLQRCGKALKSRIKGSPVHVHAMKCQQSLFSEFLITFDGEADQVFSRFLVILGGAQVFLKWPGYVSRKKEKTLLNGETVVKSKWVYRIHQRLGTFHQLFS